MTTRDSDYRAPPQISVVLGDTSPGPDVTGGGAFAWSSAENALVCWDGARWVRAGVGPEYLYGVGGDSTAAWYQTALDGGEPGVITGWGEVYLCHVAALGAAYKRIGGRWAGTGAGGGGYLYQLDTVNNLDITVIPTNTASSVYTRQILTASDAGKVSMFGWALTGTELRQYRWNQLMHAAACTGYTPPSAGYRTTHGAGDSGAAPFTDGNIIARIQYRGIPTAAQWKELSDAVRAMGDLPTYWPGLTITHRWSLKDMLRSLAAMPVGNFGYRRIMATPNGLRGHATAAWAAALLEWGSITGSECIASAIDGTTGWDLLKYSGGLMVGRRNTGGTYINTTAVPLVSADLNRKMLVGMWYSGDALRLTIDGDVASADAAGSFAPAAASALMKVGAEQEQDLYPALSMRLYGLVGGDGVAPTMQEWKQLYRDTMESGVLARVPGKTGRRWLMQQGTPYLGSVVIDAEGTSDSLTVFNGVTRTAPAVLQEAVVAAEVDALVQGGANPVAIKSVDPTIDGTITIGATGFSAYNRLQTANGLGVAGQLAGFNVATRATITSTSGQEAVAGRFGAMTGWIFYRNGTSLQFICYTGSANVSSPALTLTAAHLNRPLYLHGWIDSGKLHFAVDGAWVGSFAISAYAPSNNGTSFSTTSMPFAGVCFELSGGHFVPTQAEVMKNYLDSVRAGSLQPMPNNKSEHLWSIPKAVVANGGWSNGMPALVPDLIGTDHMTSYGGWIVGGSNGLRSNELVEALDATVLGIRTQGSSFPGTTSAWSAAVTWYDYGLQIGTAATLMCQVTFGIGAGWLIWNNPTGVYTAHVRASGAIRSMDYAVPGGVTPVGVHEAAITYDGSQFKFYFDGVLAASSATGLVFEPTTAEPLMFGSQRSASPVYPGRSKSLLGGYVANVAWTAGELSTAFAAAVAQGKPVGVPTKTDKRWSFPDDVLEASGKVPTFGKERVAGVDHVTLVNSGLQLCARAERSHTYEVKPIMTGVTNPTDTDFYQSSAGGAGNVLAWGGTIVFRPKATTLSQTRVLLGMMTTTPGNAGLDIRTTGTNAGVVATIVNGDAIARSSSVCVLTSLYQRICVFSFFWDGVTGRLRVFLNRVENGTGQTQTGFILGPGPVRIGSFIPTTGFAAIDNDFFGFSLWEGYVNTPQVQAQHDTILANDGRIVPMPGCTPGMLVDLTLDAKDNGGLLGASLKDRMTKNAMTRTGVPTMVQNNVRAFGI